MRAEAMMVKIIQKFGQYGATMKAGRPTIEFRLAKARFEGMAEMMADAFDLPTAFMIELALIELEREYGKAPAFNAMNREYKAWQANMLAGLKIKLGV